MNDTYINYIDQLLDLAERNDIFCLTSRAFNEFSAEVLESLEKRIPMKPCNDHVEGKCCPTCSERATFQTWKHGYPVVIKMNYCQACGQAIDWSEE